MTAVFRNPLGDVLVCRLLLNRHYRFNVVRSVEVRNYDDLELAVLDEEFAHDVGLVVSMDWYVRDKICLPCCISVCETSLDIDIVTF